MSRFPLADREMRHIIVHWTCALPWLSGFISGKTNLWIGGAYQQPPTWDKIEKIIKTNRCEGKRTSVFCISSGNAKSRLGRSVWATPRREKLFETKWKRKRKWGKYGLKFEIRVQKKLNCQWLFSSLYSKVARPLATAKVEYVLSAFPRYLHEMR